MEKRILFLDDMRVIACFMVIMIHSCEFFFIDGPDIGIHSLTDGFWVSVIDSAFRCSVPLFVMISAFLLAPVQGDITTFFRKRLLRVVVPFIFWSILYAVLPALWEETDIPESLLQLTHNFNDTSGHLWFVYMLIGLYLFMPVISPWLEKAGKKEEQLFLLLWFLSSCFVYLHDWLGPLFGECYWNEYHTLWYFSGFLGYVVLAHYIRHHLKWSRTKCLALGTALYLTGYYFTATIWYDRITTADTLQQLELSWRFCSPNVIAMSFGAFIIIRSVFSRRKHENRIVKEISALSYGIYLMHILVLGAVYRLLEGQFPTQWTIPAVGILTFIICCLLAKVISLLRWSKYIIG